MRRILCFLFACFASSTAYSQGGYIPPAYAAYIYNGTSWAAATTTSTQGAIPYTPTNVVGLYGFNSTLNQWVPLSAVGGGGGSGGGGVGQRNATVVVAPSNATSAMKAGADVVCSGTSDETCINNAIATYCPSSSSSSAVSGCLITLLDGVFNTAGSIVIDNDDVALVGLHHCMWGGFNRSWGGTSTPTGSVGTGCSQIRASSTGFDLIHIANANPGGNGVDTYRHRGIRISQLYLVGNSYTATGISNAGGGDDNLLFNDNVIQRTLNGITGSYDSITIKDNSLQDIAGDAITTTSGEYPRILNNLVFDIGGNCFVSTAYSPLIEHNVCGDAANGAVLSGDNSIVNGNTFPGIRGKGTAITGNSSAVSGNTYTNSQTGAITFTSVTGGSVTGNSFVVSNSNSVSYPTIVATGSKAISVTGNNESNTTGGSANPMLDFANSTASSATGNTASGLIGYGTPVYINANVGAANFGDNITNPGITPINSAHLIVRYQATSLAGLANGAAVTNWPDSGGLSYNATTVFGTPHYVTSSTINSAPAVRFNGSTDSIGNTGLALPNSATSTFFLVYNISTLPSALGHTSDPFNAVGTSSYINTGNVLNIYTGNSAAIVGVAASTTYVMEVVTNGSSSRVSLNGTSYTFTSGSPSWPNSIYLASNAGSSEFFAGDIAEFAGYNGAATVADATLVGSALCVKYNVTCGGAW